MTFINLLIILLFVDILLTVYFIIKENEQAIMLTFSGYMLAFLILVFLNINFDLFLI